MKSLHLAEHDCFIRYLVIPGDGPVHVYLPGLICPSAATLLQVATHRRLADRSAVLVDYLGCGLSDRPAGFSHTMRDHAMTVAAILDREGVAEATIVGHSMGGTVGLFLALARPDLVGRLVLGESNLLPGGGDGTRRIASFGLQDWLASAAPDELVMLRRAAKAGSAAAADYLGIREWGSDARAVHAASVDIVGLDPSTQQRFLDLEVPRSFIYGGRTLDELAGRWTPDVPDRELLEANGVTTFVVDGVGHFMYGEDLDGYVDAVVDATAARPAVGGPT